MTNESVLTVYQSLHHDYQNVQGYAAIRAFYRRARLARAMDQITQAELEALLAAGADEREWLTTEIEQQKAALATRKQTLIEHDVYRQDVDVSKLGLPTAGALGFTPKTE